MDHVVCVCVFRVCLCASTERIQPKSGSVIMLCYTVFQQFVYPFSLTPLTPSSTNPPKNNSDSLSTNTHTFANIDLRIQRSACSRLAQKATTERRTSSRSHRHTNKHARIPTLFRLFLFLCVFDLSYCTDTHTHTHSLFAECMVERKTDFRHTHAKLQIGHNLCAAFSSVASVCCVSVWVDGCELPRSDAKCLHPITNLIHQSRT